MSFLTVLRDLDRKFSWSFFGFMLAAVLALFTAYDRLWANKQPQLYFDVLTSTSVLDIKEDLPKLDVLFDGFNIREQNLSLHIVTVKIINDSPADILTGHYDMDAPLGFAVSPGRIIRTEVTEASNAYLERNVSLSSPTNNVVQFKNVILEAHEFFVLKVLILHPASRRPTVAPVGHVAGVKELIVREPYRDTGTLSFWARTFSASIGSQAVRLVAYTVLAILLLLLVVLPVGLISEKMAEWQRGRTVKAFKCTTAADLDENDEFIFTCYISDRSGVLLTMTRLARSPKALHKAYQDHCRDKKHRRRQRKSPALIGVELDAMVMPELLEAGFVTVVDGAPSVDPHQRATLEQFMRFLKGKGIQLHPIYRQMMDFDHAREMVAFRADLADELALSEPQEDPPDPDRDPVP